VTARYIIRPKADQDLTDQAYYLATQTNPRVGHNFLLAAHETFSLLATQPDMGWHSRLKNPALASLRVFRVSGFEKLLILYRPCPDGVEILRVVHASRNLEAFLRRDRVE
jgi:toxin ParE1/3/4